MTTANSPEQTQVTDPVAQNGVSEQENTGGVSTSVQAVIAPVKKKKSPAINSLGHLAKKQDYETLMMELRNLELPENADQRAKFYDRKEGDFPSEMDKLLVALIANMAPKPEEETNTSNLGQGTGMNTSSTPVMINGVPVGAPIAPAMGAMQGAVSTKKTWNEVLFEDIEIKKDNIPLLGIECIEFMLEKGVNPNVCTMAGLNAVMMACTLNNEQPLLCLINNSFKGLTETWEEYNLKGNLNHEDVLGNDALAYAVLTGAFYMADYLMNEQGFNINKKYFRMQNQTLLHIVAERFNYKTEAHPLQGFLYSFEENSNENKIAFLLERGADASLSDMNGKVPEECIPMKTPELEEELGKITEEEEACWDRCFNKIGEKRKEFESVKKANRKFNF